MITENRIKLNKMIVDIQVMENSLYAIDEEGKTTTPESYHISRAIERLIDAKQLIDKALSSYPDLSK